MGEKRMRVLRGESKVAAQMESQLACERERNAVMEQNKKRMLELGLLDLANDLALSRKKPQSAKGARLAKLKSSLAGSPGERPERHLLTPVRRSSRLKGTHVDYFKDEELKIGDEHVRGRRIKIGEGSKPEIYTAEHEKLLGDYETPWDLFVDGCDENGGRIYDSDRGKTCHQCRQKTLGRRTSCSSCNALQGQFCGDCLFMRYGENVLETIKNPKWTCPICRGICNCSLCRPKRGWPPTGALYRRVLALGYKSVAHYLIYTRRATVVSDDDEVSEKRQKRSK